LRFDDGATVRCCCFIVADVLVCGALLRSWLCMCELIHHKNKRECLEKALRTEKREEGWKNKRTFFFYFVKKILKKV